MAGLVEVWEQVQASKREADHWLAAYGEAQKDVAKILARPVSDAEKLTALQAWVVA